MKRILSTRMYDFNYFHGFFINYYINQSYDDILVFCKSEHVSELRKSFLSTRIKLIELPQHQIPYIYKEEKAICNWIFQKTLDYYENNYLNNEAIILFADDDEFYPILQPDSIISRTIFLEWHLHSSNTSEIDAAEFYNLIQSNKCKGQLLTIWNDPYYKESIIKLSIENLPFYRECLYSNAFHRITHNNKLININKNCFYADHLKGIPLPLAKKRIIQKVNAIKSEDDWCSNHYSIEFMNYCLQFEKFYNGLQTKEQLNIFVQKKLDDFKGEISFYEDKVLPLDWSSVSSNVPSTFFKKKLY